MISLADVLRRAPQFPDDLTDRDLVVGCSCGTEQRLNVMTVGEYGPVTLYDCAVCTTTLVGVLPDDPRYETVALAPMTRRQEAGGHRLHGHVVGSRCDVVLRPVGAEKDLAVIPATPTFFAQYLNL